MKISCDPEGDALYISFNQGPAEVTTIRLSEDLAIDRGTREEIVDIKVLDASGHLDLERLRPQVVLENLELV